MPTKAAVRAPPSGRTGHLGGEVDAMIVINGEDTDEADSVATAAAAGVDAAAAAAAADAVAERHDETSRTNPDQYMLTDGGK